MTDTIAKQSRIEIVQGVTGQKAVIAGHRVRVLDVAIWTEHMGMSPDEIVEAYPTLSLADVQAALAYYRDHRGAIDRAIEEDRAAVEEYCRRFGPGPLAEKLRRRGE